MSTIYGTPPGPQVTNVYVGAISPGSGTLWQPNSLAEIASLNLGSSTLGYRIPVGVLGSNDSTRTVPGQLDSLPWTNINCISLSFNEDVNVSINNLTISGLLKTYSIYNFSYGLVNNAYTASWFFAQSGTFSRDKIRITLSSASVKSKVTNCFLAGAIVNAQRILCGDPVTSAGTTLPNRSANGTNFSLILNILPGDIDNDGAVVGTIGAGDRAIIAAKLSTAPPGGSYSIYADLNLNAVITNQDNSILTSLANTVAASGLI
jgi:hypothetical protein